jgi:hypothetical protein
MRAKTATSAMVAAAILASGCSGERVITTDDPPVRTPTATSAPPPLPPPDNARLVDAFDYVAHVNDAAGYYFTTPSGRWRCAIFPRTKAGCQSARSWQSGLGVNDEPDGANAIVVERGDPHFVTLEQPEFGLNPGPANTLPFNKTLAVAGFRCNVQEEAGVSCASELTGKGFTFSAEGFVPQYTEVPPTAP